MLLPPLFTSYSPGKPFCEGTHPYLQCIQSSPICSLTCNSKIAVPYKVTEDRFEVIWCKQGNISSKTIIKTQVSAQDVMNVDNKNVDVITDKFYISSPVLNISTHSTQPLPAITQFLLSILNTSISNKYWLYTFDLTHFSQHYNPISRENIRKKLIS